jgi:hypothetical protein
MYNSMACDAAAPKNNARDSVGIWSHLSVSVVASGITKEAKSSSKFEGVAKVRLDARLALLVMHE